MSDMMTNDSKLIYFANQWTVMTICITHQPIHITVRKAYHIANSLESKGFAVGIQIFEAQYDVVLPFHREGLPSGNDSESFHQGIKLIKN